MAVLQEKSYAVLGLGRYGRKVAETVALTGVTVLVADSDIDIVDSVSDKFTSAVSLDMTNAEALGEIGLENIDIAIIDLSGDLEASVICTMAVKDSGVDRIIATANSNHMGEILKKIGADEIVIPEEESALRLAKSLISEDFMEYTDLGDGLCIVKVLTKKEWGDKSIRSLKLHERNGITIVAVQGEDGLTSDFNADWVMEAGTPVVLAMDRESLYQFV